LTLATQYDILSKQTSMIRFWKFHGTGNDFVMLDGREITQLPEAGQIEAMCNRHTGIGADGLIVLTAREGYDFEMIYFNSDGSPATMCGNGARCAAAFGLMRGISGISAHFLAGDGPHTATISAASDGEWMVEISMCDISVGKTSENEADIHTGTPHHLVLTPDPEIIDVKTRGRSIRYSPAYAPVGTNVNFMAIDGKTIRVRTYEKGVEDETLSCGTGVTASAAFAAVKTGRTSWEVLTRGGRLEVKMIGKGKHFTEVHLKGPAVFVFSGTINASYSEGMD